ncbi:MAG TPA: hypothetical protein ENH20_00090, partial [Candidatus Pacearchaeota archaeon]|nr:hypothetical protein [Candidatus Pacearchaeota archaeon]
MAYKRYIKRNGKIYGPYYQHSVKKDGKVVSKYIKKSGVTEDENNKKLKKKIIIFIVLGLLGILMALAFLNFNLTGNVSLEIEDNYISGEPIQGNVKLNLAYGEFIPTNSKVIINNSGDVNEYLLSEFISASLISDGDFYAEDREISGAGEGYGAVGKKDIYPEVEFTLKISDTINNVKGLTGKVIEEIDEETEEVAVVEEDVKEKDDKNEKINDGENKKGDEKNGENKKEAEEVAVVEEDVKEKDDKNEKINDGENKKGDEKNGENKKEAGEVDVVEEDVKEDVVSEIVGTVSIDKPYTYTLKKRQTAEVVGSEQDIDFEINGNVVTITTDYFETSLGHGDDYLTDDILELNLDLTNLGLVAKEGELSFSLVYDEEELVFVSKVISVEGVSEPEKETKVIDDLNVSFPEIIQTNISKQNTTGELINNSLVGVNISVNTIQLGAIVGKPVKWKKNVKSVVEINNISLELPREATNITAYKIVNEIREEVNAVEKTADIGVTISSFGMSESQEASETREVTLEDNSTEFEVE